MTGPYDRHIGPALFVDVERETVRIDGYRILSFSAWRREAYADPGDHVPGDGLLVWNLSSEQVEHLIERCPGKRLATECQFNDAISPAA